MNPPLTPEIRRLCRSRLNELRATDIAELTHFAAFRLMRLGRSFDAGPDLVQNALLAVLLGLESNRGGRRPRRADVTNHLTFTRYIRGVILSGIQSQTRRIKARHQHLPVAEPGEQIGIDGVVLSSPLPIPSEQAALHDLQDELFRCLRKRAPRHLKQIIKLWKRDFAWTDTIPLNGAHRQYRAELRELARQILSETEPTLQPCDAAPRYRANR